MSLVLVVALPFIASILAALLPSDARNRESTLAGLVALACAASIAWLFPQVARGEVIVERFTWVPALGLDFVLRLDGFA